ncbi:hypothetical protein [Christiangramia sabulilitoris]|uniref:Uncharacterized protein n=1 Tax=Christiangramia sabulilitoris TaxID=2583991 RepID=A0A550I6V4_9FLAO|nr:hypothetical protein [Christiangramia sabulilitoris]TRO66700.1 hypothetical protein FGM01_02085 [Christiangramia sabulilitoris]
MADIRIEKKKPVWPWLFLIIILAILVFLYFYGSMSTEENDEIENIDYKETTSQTSASNSTGISSINI